MTKPEIEKLAEAHVIEVGIEYERDKNKIPTLHDSFKAGYLKGVEYALNEAVEICKQFERTDTISTPFNESARNGISIVRRRIEQIERVSDKKEKEYDGNDDGDGWK